MTGLFPISLDDEVNELRREVALRKRVYPRWVADKRLTREKAEQQIAIMESAIESLYRLKDLEK